MAPWPLCGAGPVWDILQIIEKSKVFAEKVVVEMDIVGQRHQPTFIELF